MGQWLVSKSCLRYCLFSLLWLGWRGWLTDVAEAGKVGSEYYHMGMYFTSLGKCFEDVNKTVDGKRIPQHVMRMRRVGGKHSIDAAHEVVRSYFTLLLYLKQIRFTQAMLRLQRIAPASLSWR